MSAAATPSPLISEMSALAAFAFAAIASRASFPVVVTPSVTRAKSGAALTLASPVTSTQRSLLMSSGGDAAASGGAERRQEECDEQRTADTHDFSLPRAPCGLRDNANV